jgi:SAM-dependent methyltransferase
MKKIFVDKEINIFSDDIAEKMIKEKNETKYLVDDSIMVVDQKRWEEAQHYEKKTWMVSNRHISDDRNYEHFKRFNSYEDLIKYENINKIENVIELGCGPFTNIRTILNILPNLKKIDLLDPLLDDYLTHPNCFYKDKKILNYEVKTHPIPIEKFETIKKYDMVLMNNVLEHCYDIHKIFDVINSILKENGILVFSDVYFKSESLKIILTEVYDAGHPLKLSEFFMENFLNGFKSIYNKDYHNLYNQSWRNDKYFIGVKK